jgi:tryptophan synthase alpha chain
MASARALNAGMDVGKTLNLIKAFRQNSNTPIVIFTYLNPIYNYGFEEFHKEAASHGADGILILDLPPDEQKINNELCEHHELVPIRLIAPTTPNNRIKEISDNANGFIYYVSREGVTGKQTKLSDNLDQQVNNLKDLTDLPLVVGFGISTPEQASSVAKLADGVVVGSAIVDFIYKNSESEELGNKLKKFVTPIIEATKNI